MVKRLSSGEPVEREQSVGGIEGVDAGDEQRRVRLLGQRRDALEDAALAEHSDVAPAVGDLHQHPAAAVATDHRAVLARRRRRDRVVTHQPERREAGIELGVGEGSTHP